MALVLVVLSLVAGQSAGGDGGWFFDWLHWFFNAGEIAPAPEVTPEDLEAIQKLEVLLEAYNQGEQTAGNFLLRGVLAAARRQREKAVECFTEAAARDPESALPLIAIGQTHLQEGALDEALAAHHRALEKATELRRAGRAYEVNCRLDLAVVHREMAKAAPDDESRHDQETEALRQATLAIGRLDEAPDLPDAQRVLAYLQAGIVCDRALGQGGLAVEAWRKGAAISDRGTLSLPNERLAVRVNIELARTTWDHNEAVQRLEKAKESVGRLPEEAQVNYAIQLSETAHDLEGKVRDRGVRERVRGFLKEIRRTVPETRLRELDIREKALRHEAALLERLNPRDAERRLKEATEIRRRVRAITPTRDR